MASPYAYVDEHVVTQEEQERRFRIMRQLEAESHKEVEDLKLQVSYLKLQVNALQLEVNGLKGQVAAQNTEKAGCVRCVVWRP